MQIPAKAQPRWHVIASLSLPTFLPIALAVATGATGALYLGYTAAIGTPLGFPLDDSWIHQTFARNLARTGGFTYNPGELSTGSTSPLWTLLLALGYLLPVDFRVWAYALGLLFLVLSASTVASIARWLIPGRPALHVAAALATAFEWHLSWAAVSGMETTLFTMLSLLLVHLTVRGRAAALLGLVGGLLTLARPEGILLVILALTWRFIRQRGPNEERLPTPLRAAGSTAVALVVWAIVVAPDIAYNAAVTGVPLPATYYAKSTAYAVDVGPISIVRFLGRATVELAIGPLLLMYPGLLYLLFHLGRSVHRLLGGGRLRPQGSLAPLALPVAWILTFLLLYAVRLPVVFHHGRYLMPLIPWLILFGSKGLAALLGALPLRLLGRVFVVLVAAFWLVMWVNGAVVYRWDNRFIDDEQVTVANWLRDNTPPDALIATHDVGAIGYFAGRHLIDTAGLITPALASHARDQAYIRDYLDRHRIEYLAMFPAWYPAIADDPGWEVIFRVDQTYPLAQGAENMVVLRNRWLSKQPSRSLP